MKLVLAAVPAVLAVMLCGCGGSSPSPATTQAPTTPLTIVTENAEGEAVIDEGAEVILVGTGYMFTEGPLWMPDDAAWIFADLPAAIQHKWVPATNVLSIYRQESATNWINAAAFDQDGNLVTCEMGGRGISRTNLSTGVREVIVHLYQGKPFTGPNDVIVSKAGMIFFSDTSYGMNAHGGVNEIGSNNVYRFDPATQDLKAVVTDMDMPNGLAFSPDEQTLYVADSGASRPLGAPLNFSFAHEVLSYDLAADGTTSNRQTFWATPEAEVVPDGIKVDRDGNVWSSSHAGVKVFKPDGTLIARIDTPAETANLAFGGETGMDLMITSSDSVWLVKTKTTAPTVLHQIQVQV